MTNQMHLFQQRKTHLQAKLRQHSGHFKIKKKTSSNLFRYQTRINKQSNALLLTEFNHILSLNSQQLSLCVEGMTTYEQIIRYTLPKGFLPAITPELKHITIGGAAVGIGIESSGFRHGFVHDTLLEAEVLTPNKKIIICRPDNEHADLFHALGNSYGTLGYILRAVIKLIPAKPFVCITNELHRNCTDYINAMHACVNANEHDFIEGLFFNAHEFYLTTGTFVDTAKEIFNIYGTEPYYKHLRYNENFYLKTEDYIFRYDPDWFWNIPETKFYYYFRRFAPKALRNSGLYKQYVTVKNKLIKRLPITIDEPDEQLIQDWEVPWKNAEALIQFALDTVNLNDKPWVALPIRPQHKATLYPLKPNELYFNLGCYCFVKKDPNHEPYYFTKIMDKKCFALNGLKMLYSSSFIDQNEFNTLYNGNDYQHLKEKYDTHDNAATLFEKAVFPT